MFHVTEFPLNTYFAAGCCVVLGFLKKQGGLSLMQGTVFGRASSDGNTKQLASLKIIIIENNNNYYYIWLHLEF